MERSGRGGEGEQAEGEKGLRRSGEEPIRERKVCVSAVSTNSNIVGFFLAYAYLVRMVRVLKERFFFPIHRLSPPTSRVVHNRLLLCSYEPASLWIKTESSCPFPKTDSSKFNA